MKKFAQDLLSSLGVIATKVSNSAGQTVVLSFRRMGAAANDTFPALVVAREIDGKKVHFYIEHEADSIQSHHRRGEFYEPEELRLISRYFKGGTFLDVGANAGNHTIYAAMFLNATKVIAFEPLAANARALRCNVALNNLGDIVRVHQCGLGEKRSKASSITDHSFNVGGTRLQTGTGDIDVRVGDDVVADERVAFIKVDTEGMEMSVLRGFRNTILRDKPALFVEVDSRNEAAFISLLKEYGYQIQGEFARYTEMTNYVAVPRQP